MQRFITVNVSVGLARLSLIIVQGSHITSRHGLMAGNPLHFEHFLGHMLPVFICLFLVLSFVLSLFFIISLSISSLIWSE